MKTVHALTHPSAKIERPTPATDAMRAEPHAASHPPLAAKVGEQGTTAAKAELLAVLDEEADEEEDEPLAGQSCFDDHATTE